MLPLISFALLFGFSGNTKELAKFNDWTAFAEVKKKFSMYGCIKPKKSEGNYTKRGDVFAIITTCQDKKNGANLV